VKRLIPLLLVLSLVSATACTAGRVISGSGIPATVSTEGKLAIQARAVIAASEGVLAATEAAVNAKLLTPAQGLPVAQATQQVGKMGDRLAVVLRIYESATGGARAQAATEAIKLLTDMAGSMTSLPDAVRGVVAAPLASMLELVAGLKSAL